MYIRNTNIIIIGPATAANHHAGERFAQGGAPENDLLPQGDEIHMYRIIIPEALPETVQFAMMGREIKDIMTIPEFQGFCPKRDNDIGGDMLKKISHHQIMHTRNVERGVLIAISPNPRKGRKNG